MDYQIFILIGVILTLLVSVFIFLEVRNGGTANDCRDCIRACRSEPNQLACMQGCHSC